MTNFCCCFCFLWQLSSRGNGQRNAKVAKN